MTLCSFNALAKSQNTLTNCYWLEFKRSILIKNRRQVKVHEEQIIGTLRSNDATATSAVTSLVSLRSFILYRSHSYPLYFGKCRRSLLELKSLRPYPSSEGEIKFRRCLFTYSTKREIRHVHVVVVQKQERNVQKSVMHVQSCCFAY